MKKLRLLAASLNPIMGDIDGNLSLAKECLINAKMQNCDLVLFSELFVIGYPPEDLVLKPAAVNDCMVALHKFALDNHDMPAFLIGIPWFENGRVYNGFAFCEGGNIRGILLKQELPNYDVFDEKRVFAIGDNSHTITLKGIKIGVPICEDIWFPTVCANLKADGAEILLCPNGSPYRRGVLEKRAKNIEARVKENQIPMVYVNQLGGQDELCFDGAGFVCEPNQKAKMFAPQFEASQTVLDFEIGESGAKLVSQFDVPLLEPLHQDYNAAVLALRDYVNKNRFPGVLLGLSGGIDSAISAAIAVDALGKDRVICVMMPSIYTTGESLKDAKECAEALGVRYEIASIKNIVAEFETELAPLFAGRNRDITEENIQSRSRAVILMALSNKFGNMVLTTGNKSEMAVGYATLYGDMCGGYNCLKDFYKTEVFKISEWRNRNVSSIGLGVAGIMIPPNIITKPPTAELRENQKDQDSLPPYEILDDILYCLVELEEEIEDVIARGHDIETVKRVQNLLYIAEYKRRQAPPGVKIGTKNFGRDRRYPITNRYRDKINP